MNNTQILKKKLYIIKLKRRKNKYKRRRGKHLESLFLSRKKKYLNYYQLFDSKIINKNTKVNNNVIKANKKSNNKLTFGLVAKEYDLIKIKSLKTLRFYTQRYLKSVYMYKNKLKTKINVLPNYWLTNKAKSVRMGKGKGSLTHKVAYLNKGSYLFNIKILKKNINYKINKKLYFLKFSMFINILLKSLKNKTTVKTSVYKH